MENMFATYFLGKSRFSYIKDCFEIYFAMISDWSVASEISHGGWGKTTPKVDVSDIFNIFFCSGAGEGEGVRGRGQGGGGRF